MNDEHQGGADAWRVCYEAEKAEVSRLLCEVKRANARERPAFDAGMKAAAAMAPFSIDDFDCEREWQQYRCQDETDWRVSEGQSRQERMDELGITEQDVAETMPPRPEDER